MELQRGFTLTELMVVLAIVAILLVVGVPSYQYITNANRMSGEINALLGDMQYARIEAIREGNPVTVCAGNGTTAAPIPTACAGTPNWQGGWLVWPNNATATLAAPAAGTVLRVQAVFNGTDTFVSNPAAVTQVTFNREGFATVSNGAGGFTAFAATTIVLHIASGASQWTRCLYLSAQGMMTAESLAYNPSGTCS